MKNFQEFIVNENVTCFEALKKINDNDSQSLFVVNNDNKLLGTVTDGDIRRGILKGIALDKSILNFSNKNFIAFFEKIDVNKLRFLKRSGIKILPQLNNNGVINKVYDLSKLNSILPLHAVIMAGGRGERLRPLTDMTPKPMLFLGNKPIIEHNIDRLISYGIESITISVRYLSEQIISYFGDGSNKGITIKYIVEDVPLGTIGCVSKICKDLHQDVLVLNSDIFSNIDFESLYLDFYNNQADMAVASIPYTVDIPYAIMELENNNIVKFQEKPKNTYYANAGIYIIKKDNLNFIPMNSFYNATDLMDNIIKNHKKLIHSPIAGYWIDIGKHDDYEKAKEIYKHLKYV